ncbi:competence protein TfoX [Hylemonella gracilis str. Niagara R]|uniref:Competence protein TfoX n=1 Tax=Hylemonella gracilis str. Niagara R TaxID=1458275 RepID=A0A016XF58_9BURK|nr:TfoX/Sxy family protein [Hylemonella gracilis]EYC50197.1 competence protein TfoX [Hylemonella gracilis str. Niagara R]
MAHEALAEHCIELFSPLGHAHAKRMFGGHGLYVDELCIAFIVEGRLFLKTSETTRQRFIDAGGQPFAYQQSSARKPTVVTSYWTPPAEALESPALMLPWARLAMEAALAARKPPKAPRAIKSTQSATASDKPRKSGVTAKNTASQSKPATRPQPKTGTPRSGKR